MQIQVDKIRIKRCLISLVMTIFFMLLMDMKVFATETSSATGTTNDTQPLTFTCATTQTAYITLGYKKASNLQYKKNNGDWEKYKKGTAITINYNEKVSFKADSFLTINDDCNEKGSNVSITGGKVNTSGNIMSLMNYSDTCEKENFQYMFYKCENLLTPPSLPATQLAKKCYAYMFSGCVSLKNAPELLATQLKDTCYCAMFEECVNLKNAPELPATQLASDCYDNMFSGCVSLKTAPKLRATQLKDGCYSGMFSGCIGLEDAPDLPAEKLSSYCYFNMFLDCKSLKNAPKLPATKMEIDCYFFMFSGCVSLERAPELPAIQLANGCYAYMFNRCVSLEKVPELPATQLASMCYSYMFSECTSLVESPELPAIEMEDRCYWGMFDECTSLTKIPTFHATQLANYCFEEMFYGCTKLGIYLTQQWDENAKFVINAKLNNAKDWNHDMFYGTGGYFTGDPEIGVTYYLGIPTDSRKISFETVVVDKGKVKDITNDSKLGVESNPYYVMINNSDKLVDLIDLSSKEKEEGVNIWLSMKKLEDVSLDEKERNIIKKTASDKEIVIGLLLDASLFKTSGDGNYTQIHDTKGMIKISFSIPKELRGDDREFYIMRVHNGKTEYIATQYDKDTGLCTFETDKFSTYVVCYEDSKLKNEKATFEQYKIEKINEAGKLIKTKDSSACKKLITDTKNKIKKAKYNVNKILLENKNILDDMVKKLKKDLESKRKVEEKEAKALAKKKAYWTFNAGLKSYSKNNKIYVSWGKVADASGYIVYANYCNKETLKAVKTVKGSSKTSISFTNFNNKKANTTNFIKLYVVAYKNVNGKKNVLHTTVSAHIAGSNNVKYTNALGIKLKKYTFIIKKGKSANIKATVVLSNKKKKPLDSSHGKSIRYTSSDTSIASVSSSGKITAKSKGTVTIYVMALNGYAKKVTVRVE